eukprot:CAMPEP_0172306972 /NCGR_PEP_ID=MMETSP1058-20130122/7923_1 /TAXON_ID=83371 /ORGANISM="Detonula confervacea, Strain CCMP 353" /LENGTH=714 /DNA_ID=CAMNT_0013019025 /DNA_START=167 /DNA_END=2311 /DNA_ORIENTATION=+
MGFAEQLAARAAETSSHHTKSQRPRLTPPRPRPGKIINKGRGTVTTTPGASTSNLSSSSSSPSLFADQLKLRKASRHSPSPRSLDNSFANQISERKIQNTKLGEAATAPLSTPLTLPLTTVSPSDSELLSHDATLSGGTRSSTDAQTPQHQQQHAAHKLNDSTPSKRSILIPSCESPNDSEEDDSEDDEYASVGFSLMDTSAISTVDGEKGNGQDDDMARGILQQGGEESKVVDSNDAAQEEPKIMQRTRTTSTASSTVGESHDGQTTTTQQHFPQHQLLRKTTQQTLSQALKNVNNSTNTNNNYPTKNNNSNNNNNSSPSLSSANPIFGAWAQIESLKRRVREAEERADLQECQHAAELLELANSNSNNANNNATCEHVFREENDNIAHHVGSSSSIIVGNGSVDDGAPPVISDSVASPADDVASASEAEIGQWKTRALEAEERLAKEVERLERAAAAAAAATSASNMPQSIMPATRTASRPEEQPLPDNDDDLIQLKNAEINVLRSQIHRLERRIQQEECENRNNQDSMFLRSSSSSYHHHPPLNLQNDIDHPHHPSFVVASNKEEMVCNMTHSNSTRTTSSSTENYTNAMNDYEFRILRNEIRHLQYQLQRSSNNNAQTTSAMTTMNNAGSTAAGGRGSRGGAANTAASMGESTLSLSLDGNENHYNNKEEEEEEEEEVEIMEDGGSRSSWGLCCIRYGGGRPRRGGYGRV